MGVKGACPLGLPPPLGERGGHPRNFHASLKKLEGISTEPEYFNFLTEIHHILLSIKCCIHACFFSGERGSGTGLSSSKIGAL